METTTFEQSKLRRSPSFAFSKSLQRPLSPTNGYAYDSTPNRTVTTNTGWNRPLTASSSRRPTSSQSTSVLLSARKTYMGAVGQKRPSTATLNRLIEQDVKPQVIRQISRQSEATKLLFRRLWRSPVRIPETAIYGEDGELCEWLFYSKKHRCILRKSYEKTTLENFEKHWINDPVVLKKMRNNASAPIVHMEARGGRAVILRDTLIRMINDCKKQWKRRQDILSGTGRLGNDDMKRKREKYFVGPCIMKKYQHPATNSVYTCKYERKLNPPKNPIEARKIGYQMDTFETGQISHNAAYEDLDGNNEEIRVLTMPLAPKVVTSLRSHSVPDPSKQALEDFVKFGVYHRHKQVGQSTKLKSRLKRVCDEVIDWLERRHGMLIAKLHLECIIKAKSNDISSTSNPLLVTSCSKISWVQGKPLWEVPTTMKRSALNSPKKRPINWSMEISSTPTIPLASIAKGMSDDEEDRDPVIEVSEDPTARRNLIINKSALPRGYITGLQKRTPLTRTGRERELMEHILTHNANSSKQYADAQNLTELALKKFQESTKLIKRVKKAESDSLKYQREREADERIHNDRLKKENLERRKLEMRINQQTIDLKELQDKMKITKKRLAHYEGEVKVMDEIHQQAEFDKAKAQQEKKKRDDAMDILTSSIGFDPKRVVKKQNSKVKKTPKKTNDWPTEVDKSGKAKKRKPKKRISTLAGNDAAVEKIDVLGKILNDKNTGGYFGGTLGGFLDVFIAIDTEDNGYITTEQFRDAMQLLKLKKLTDDTINSLVNAIDSDQSGTIEYEEFVSALLNRMQFARKQAKANADKRSPGRR